jgi:pyridoxal phosphate enzyme (YggS family)
METGTSYRNFISTLGSGIKLVAVSKTQPVERILEMYQAGQRIFGENRVQEFLTKKDALPGDIQWHLIGHLQTNKVRSVTGKVSLIHSVDSARLLKEINSEAAKANCITNCLLQFHIAQEETKYGFSPDEATQMLTSDEFRSWNNIRIEGVMGMATFTDEADRVRSEFRYLKTIFDQIKTEFFPQADSFREISMGMSGDYQIAIEEGSTLIRIGTLLFGQR